MIIIDVIYGDLYGGIHLGPLHSGLDWGWWTHMNYPHVVLFFVEGKEGLLQDIHGLECKQRLRTCWTSTCFLPLLVKQSPKLEYRIGVYTCDVNQSHHSSRNLHFHLFGTGMMNTLQGSNISHQTGKGKSSTHKYLGRGYVSPFRRG